MTDGLILQREIPSSFLSQVNLLLFPRENIPSSIKGKSRSCIFTLESIPWKLLKRYVKILLRIFKFVLSNGILPLAYSVSSSTYYLPFHLYHPLDTAHFFCTLSQKKSLKNCLYTLIHITTSLTHATILHLFFHTTQFSFNLYNSTAISASNDLYTILPNSKDII